MKLAKLTAALSITLLLNGCGGNPVIPVSDLTPKKSRYQARIVMEGDSLYTIAWEFGLDYREVALWNRLRPPYQVTPGAKDSLRSFQSIRTVQRKRVTYGRQSVGEY